MQQDRDAGMPAAGDTPGGPDGIIRRRRTARSFDPSRPIPDGLLRTLLELAAQAPSTANLQPWRFVIVREAENRRLLRRCAGNQPRISQAPVVVIVLGYEQACRTHLEPVLEAATRAAAVTPAEAAEWRGRALARDARSADRGARAVAQAMLAAATLMLAAEAHGLGSALLEVPEPEPLRDEFGIPDDHHVACLVALGFPADAVPFPGRLDLDELCHGEHFGAPFAR